MISLTDLKSLRVFDWIMIASFSLATTETIVYFAAISGIPPTGPITYPRLFVATLGRNAADFSILFATCFLFAMFLVVRARMPPVAEEPSLLSTLLSASEGIILGHFVSRFALGNETTSLREGIIVTVVGALLGLIPPASSWLLPKNAITFGVMLGATLWFTAFVLVVQTYIVEGHLYEPEMLRNYGYYKDGVLLLVILLLVGYLPKLIRDNAYGTAPLMILAVGVANIGVIATALDLHFSSTPQGDEYARMLIGRSGRQDANDVRDMVAAMDLHAQLRSGVLLLIGVVLVFVVETLSLVQRRAPRPDQAAVLADQPPKPPGG